MKAIIQSISCFLCCLLTMLILCSCQTEAANNNDNQEDKKLLGDADGDGDITIMDVTTIQRYLAGVSVPSFDRDAADANGSGDIEITDGTLIQRHLVGISVPYKIGELISDQENQGDEPFTLEQTGMTDPVPSTYLSAAQQGGSVQRIEYDSIDYAESGDPVKKQAYVYLPYGYDEADADTRYNILYLMHGWGGSAGARMAAWLGTYGTTAFGEKSYPKPAAVIMQYTGLSEVTGNEPPTYNCVGTGDGIANYRTMQNRINAIKANGTDAQIEIFSGLPHGFGLGTGTVAEGWINTAVAFWEKHI